MRVLRKKTYIDLFAGCGGLSLGLHHAGWEGLFAIEKSYQAFKTLEFNLIDRIKHFQWPEWLPKQAHDINSVIAEYTDKLEALQGKVTLVAGGPPCQGFSIAGHRNENDERNKLIESYIKFVSLVKPDLIFFENVKGFTMEFRNNAAKGRKYSQIVTSKLTEEGYYAYGQLVNFGEYGIPQKRIRFILVGIRKDIEGASVEKAKSFFRKLEENKFSFLQLKNIPIHPTVEEALSDLIRGNEVVATPDRKGFKSGLYKMAMSPYQHFVREETKQQLFPNSHSFAKQTLPVVKRLRHILSVATECKDIGKTMKSELGITTQVLIPLRPNEQSPTVTSHPDDMIHYCEPRILTVRECARLQSFPDNFEFKEKYTTGGKYRKYEVPRYTQVGNAIPPLFGEQSGLILDWLRYG
jgi:DNA (cytosine-5)-methyltransferase 1